MLIFSISLPTSKITEINFELKQDIKKENEKIENLTEIVLELKKENNVLKKEINELKEQMKEWIKYKYLFDNLFILNLDSLVIGSNIEYNTILKIWINPNKKIKSELLYRLSRDGEEISTFHKLCDNEGPTLTLYHIEDGNKVGFYSPLTWDSNSEYKNDIETFLFNLNKQEKYKKITSSSSIYCHYSHGPYVKAFGTGSLGGTMKKVSVINIINSYFENGINVLPGINSSWTTLNVKEVEVFKIIYV